LKIGRQDEANPQVNHTIMTEPVDSPPTLTLKCNPADKQLVAIIPEGTNVLSISLPDIHTMISDQGCAEWRMLNDALAQVCKLMGTLTAEREVIVAEYLDGEFSLSVSDDFLIAYLSITSPSGGNAVEESQVSTAMANRGFTQGITHDAIRAAIVSCNADKILVARGISPKQGTDTTFESLVPEAKDIRPKVNDDGSVDYHEIGAFITVNVGDKLMRRLPSTAGTNGIDVYGKVISATAGKDLSYANGLCGVETDPDDANVLIASIGGQPEIIEAGAKVHPVINVKNVDMGTGNIDFNGTVKITGDVSEGMKIYATGDILINGMVEGAELSADGDIIINKGVIGRGEARSADGEPGVGAAQLTSGGSIEARFIENALVEAAENVTVGELVSHSEIIAHNQVVIGKKGAKKGHILGGKVQARMRVTAQVIGSQANIQTLVQVGSNPELREKRVQLKAGLQEKMQEYEKLTTLISRLRNQKDEKSKAILVRALSTLKKLNTNIKEITEQQEILTAQDELISESKVTVGKHAFPGVVITVCDSTHSVRDRTEAGEFLLDEDYVQFRIT